MSTSGPFGQPPSTAPVGTPGPFVERPLSAPASTPGPIVEQPIRPSVAWFWIGGAIGLLTIGAAVAWFVAGFVGVRDTVRDFERVPFDETGGTVVIERPGGQVIYVEGGGRPVWVAADVRVFDPSGDPVRVSRYQSELDYDFGSQAGTAAATFRAETAGEYEVRAAEGTGTTGLRLAIGESLAPELVRTIVGAIVVGILGGLASFTIIVVTAVRRSNERKRRRRAHPDSWYTGPPGTAPPTPWPGTGAVPPASGWGPPGNAP